MSDRGYGAVAFLVFFTTTAGTRIISSDFGLIAANRLAFFLARTAVSAGGLRLGAAARFDRAPRLSLLLSRLLLRRALVALHLHVKQLLADVLADAAHH